MKNKSNEKILNGYIVARSAGYGHKSAENIAIDFGNQGKKKKSLFGN